MNKDVIYIEPEDDITDIVTKIENSQSKIVAIVPPKKADILHSSINIKLMDKAGKNAEKKLVLVTEDAVIIKHAASVKMPITKDLQSAPSIPTLEEVTPAADNEEAAFDELKTKKKTAQKASDELIKNAEANPEELESSEATEEAVAEAETAEASETEEAEPAKEEAKEEKGKKKSKKDKNTKKEGNWFKKHRLWFFIGIPLVGIIATVLVWALVIAPAVDITITVKTKVDKLSESITFTTKLEEEDIAAGKFFLEEKKIGSSDNVRFTATGKKNVGDKAKGNVIVYQYFKESGRIAINAGSTFFSQNLMFYADENTEFGWDGKTVTECSNNNDPSLVTDGCLIYARINVTAAEAGSEYNIANNNSWTTTANVFVYSDSNMTSGTDRSITVVQESDIEKAKAELITDAKEAEIKDRLLKEISDDSLKIDSSFKITTGDIVSTPKVGEEVAEGVEPTLATTTTATVYIVDLTKIREFITTKAKEAGREYVYTIGNPFVENFTSAESGFIGRLKTNYTYGPKVSEEEIVELVKGRRFGDVKHIVPEGVHVEINRNYPWVTSVPTDTNKISVTIKEE